MLCRNYYFFQLLLSQNKIWDFALPSAVQNPKSYPLLFSGKGVNIRKCVFQTSFQTVVKWSCLALVWVGLIGAIALWNPSPALADDYNKASLINADFSGRALTDSSFTKANLRGSNFSDSNLQGVSFFGANLERASFERANLSYATLDSARFVDTNFTHAVLEGAFAFNANFEGAVIDGADFTDVLLRQDVQEKLCEVAQGTNPTTGRNTRDTLECY
jgi:uncharacterized protein YjbI with pentapeptide repeats